MKTPRQERPRVVLVNRCFVQRIHGVFLLIRRSSVNIWMPGAWEAPGGKLDEGQDLSHALEREVLEETGLLINNVSPLVYADSEIISEGRYKGLPYVVLFSIAQAANDEVQLSEEHDEYRWVTYDDALALPLKPEMRKALIVLEKQLRQEVST